MALVGIPAAGQPGKLAPSSEYRSPTAAAAAALPKAVARRQRERTAGHRGGIARTAAIQGGLDRGAPPLGARAELLRHPFIACRQGRRPMTFQSWSARMGLRPSLFIQSLL